MKANEIIKDRYQLLRPLGAGGFGEVWLAKDQMTGTHCAVKFYVRLDDAGRSEFRGEYSRMLGIHHPNLLTASYYDEWQGRPFLVMDYCGGGAASGKVGQLSETELWRLIRDVASGLTCLHSQRDVQGKEAPVIHQDIKPDNFLQKDDGTWLISDFGISSRMRSSMSSQSGREVSSGGTIPYMGPERFGQDKMLVKASDIWSIGASIYEMVTGDVPFGEFGGGAQRAGAETPHLPRESWSSDLDRLVSSCLQKETWDRPSAELVAEYADCKLKGKLLPKLPPDVPNTNSKPKPWKWIAAAGAVVAVILAIVLWPKPSIDPEPLIDPDTQAYEACETVNDYRAYMSNYGRNALHYAEAKTFVDNFVADSIQKVGDLTPTQPEQMTREAAEQAEQVTQPEPELLEMPTNTRSEVYYSDNTIHVDGRAVYKMIHVSGGTFQMGSDDSDANDNEKPVHNVTVSTFYMGETEVTQALWKVVMGENPSFFIGANRPVEQVSWNDCQKFIRKLNQLTDKTFRLPSEAEWEYAARGGNQGNGYKYAGSNNIIEVAWCQEMTNNQNGRTIKKTPSELYGTRPVMAKLSNELGLYDMSGNVSEYCQDRYGDYGSSQLTNPMGPADGVYRVLRGGSWCGGPENCRISNRGYGLTEGGGNCIGFRLCLSQLDILSQVSHNNQEIVLNGEDEQKNQAKVTQTSLTSTANGHEYVDLGLPCGTLWATCNVGTSKPEDYGDYFAWGETKTKSNYDWDTYKYANGFEDKLTKYCSKSDYGNNGFTDKLITLQTGDDPASANWGSDWHTPTKAQWDELLNNTTNKWTMQNGKEGRLFTAKNGQTFFLPAAGHRLYRELNNAGIYGYYWSRSLRDNPSGACYLSFSSVYCCVYGTNRCYGFCVRPVREK